MPEVSLAIVGTRFKGRSAVESLARGTVGYRVRLVREPDNEYDQNAVACYVLGAHCGFLPRRHNTAIARAMDAGIVVEAMITRPAVVSDRSHRITSDALVRVTW